MRLPLTSGIQRGTGQKTGDRRTVDDQNLAFQLWLFKGTEDYKSVTNVLSRRDGFSFTWTVVSPDTGAVSFMVAFL